MTPNPKSQATEKAELLPCPFCGGNPSIVGGDDYFTIHCNNCRAELVGGKREWVKKNWNRRAAPAFNAAEKRTIFDAIGEAEHLLEETVNKLDPDNERDSWFMVRLTKIREALADQGSLADAAPPVNATLLASQKVCAEIMEIMNVYHEQEASRSGVDTPGGLEHMGDVWGLFLKWEEYIKRADAAIKRAADPGQ